MYIENEEFRQIEDDKLLWRFLDLPRYIDLLIKKQLFFCRADRFEDPFEGRLNKLTENDLQENLTEKSSPSAADYLKDHSRRRISTTVNCWHQNNDENYAMWQIYARGDFGIAIQTTYKNLKECFQKAEEEILIGKVNYFDETSDRLPLNGNYAPFLYKRNIYKYENEIRCCHTVKAALENGFDWEICPQPNGVFIDVNTEKLIRKVYISPNSPKWFKEVVADINRKYEVNAEVIQSKVFESLDFSY